jgi:hypothetical protein
MTARDATRGSRLDRPGGVQQRPGEQLRRVDAHPIISLELIDDAAGDRRGPNHRIKTGRNPTLIRLRRPISRSRLRLQLRCLNRKLRHAVIAQTRTATHWLTMMGSSPPWDAGARLG